MSKYYSLIIVFIIFLNINLLANEIKDENFKSIGARASGMGGAFTSVADDYSSFFWNPAGLVNINKIITSIFFDSVFTGKQNIYGVNYLQPIFSDMSASLTYLKMIFNESNFNNDFLYLSFATYLHENKEVSFGINLKLLNYSLVNYEFYGFTTAIDAGFMFFPEILDKKIRFSLTATDLDAKIKWSNGLYEKIPSSYKAGVSYRFDNSSIIAMDIIMTNFDLENKILRFGVSAGGEKYFLNDIIGNIGFRTGLFYIEKLNLSFGLSYERKEFSINYVFIPDFYNFGQTHKLDFSYFIGEEIRKEYKKETIPEIDESNIVMLKQMLKRMKFDISSKYISPNNDGINDSIEIVLKNNPEKITGCKWSIKILNKKDEIIKEIKGNEIIQPKIIWDGKNGNGKNIADGDYTIKYCFLVEDKIIWEMNRIVTIDTKPPAFKLTAYPKIFAPVENSKIRKLQLNFDFIDKDINAWTIIILNEKNNIIRKMSGEGIIDKIFWNGDDALGNLVIDGNYKIKMVVTDFAGNNFEQFENIIVDTYISDFNIIPDKRLFNVGKEKVNLILNKKDINKIKKVDVEIYDNNKNILKIMKNINRSNDILTWDGTDEKNQYIKKGKLYTLKLLIEQINNIEIEKEYIIQTKPPEFEGIGIQLILAAIDFENKSYDISIEEYGYLNQAAEAINKYAKNYFVNIKGYAVDYEDSEKNLQLSIQRVLAIYNYFITEKKLNPDYIYLTGYGDGNLIEGINKDTILKSGRRVEVELLTK